MGRLIPATAMAACLLALGTHRAAAEGGRVEMMSPLVLKPGEFYFRLGERPTFLLGRNPTGWQVEQFSRLFQWAGESGERIVRIHVMHGLTSRAAAGQVDDEWARRWELIFDQAAREGLYVLPVLGVWADWNDGGRGERWHSWHKNPFDASNGGPAKTPSDLFQASECRQLWLRWLTEIVGRWQTRPNVMGWEVFSELDLVTGASESAALEFAECAAKAVRSADPQSRPVTASLSGINEWPKLFGSPALDFIQAHPYADHPRFKGNLDELILSSVRERLKRYGKAVFIGEGGLDSSPGQNSLILSPRADVAIRHAVWASLVSGAMNGRMLWWEDGYDQYMGFELRERRRHAAMPVARFVKDVDFTDFRPGDALAPSALMGGAVGSKRVILGWFRDARCAAPDWPAQRVEGQTVRLSVPGSAVPWSAEFCDPRTGAIVATQSLRCEEGQVRVLLPPFEESIAFRLSAGGP
ncbi:MAG: glycoside hydrolase family 5 protein [Planctomycetes bacterium]|nr:glycoside hydrolase family 5 protein [Planctomycetota bacterium]MBM4080619.1 glycoside hydrolase family 5 protein [Planctomycetota bacterium]